MVAAVELGQSGTWNEAGELAARALERQLILAALPFRASVGSRPSDYSPAPRSNQFVHSLMLSHRRR